MKKIINSIGSHRSTNQIVFELITNDFDVPATKILDFGAGSGHMCQRLAEFSGFVLSQKLYYCGGQGDLARISKLEN